MSDFQSAVENVRTVLRAKKQTLQPTLIVVGHIFKAESYHFIVDDTIYDFSTFLQAVDSCFKFIFATDCKYPDNCSSIWLFIQKAFYDIHLPTDKVTTAVNILIGQAIKC